MPWFQSGHMASAVAPPIRASSATAAARVFVAHPERQHSDQLAAALAGTGQLAGYVHGPPLPAATAAAIPSQLRRRLGFCRIGRRALQPFVAPRAGLELYYRMIWAFDRLMTRRISSGDFDAVVGYENAALEMFQAAKRRGLACILDNSGVHHAMQDRFIPIQVSPKFHGRIVARKEQELALADVILTCSQFAFDSFVAGGVPRSKLRLVPLGCDTTQFSSHTADTRQATGPIRFLFVGRMHPVKGADLLATAATSLKQRGTAFSLAVAAALADADPETVRRMSAVAELLDKVPHAALPAVYAAADCVVVPSRFDSFAVVVAEALASGVPVIVSENVGAKDMVTDGVNGWIVPAGDAGALEARMLWCALHTADVRAMQAAARAGAEQWGWSRYRALAAATVGQFMTEFRGGDVQAIETGLPASVPARAL